MVNTTKNQMNSNKVAQYTDMIKGIYTIHNSLKGQEQTSYKPTLIEYIEYTNNTNKGFRVESKRLTQGTINSMSLIGFELQDIFPTLDNRLIATYHFMESS